MKKYLLAAVACLTALSTQAQDVTVVSTRNNYTEFQLIPSTITSSGKAMFVIYNDREDLDYYVYGDDIVLEYQIFDSSFNLIKTINASLDVNGESTILGVRYYDVAIGNNDHDPGDGIVLSQTLFNSDDKFEYIRYNYPASPNMFEGEYRAESFSIVQDDGTVLATIPATEGRELNGVGVVKSYDAVYLIAEEEKPVDNWNYRAYTVVYKWNGSGNSVSKVSETNTMRTYPNPIRHNQNVTVEIPEEVNDGVLLVTSASGATLQHISVNGQRQVSVSTACMTSGVYNVTLVANGQQVQTNRIIVQ